MASVYIAYMIAISNSCDKEYDRDVPRVQCLVPWGLGIEV